MEIYDRGWWLKALKKARIIAKSSRRPAGGGPRRDQCV